MTRLQIITIPALTLIGVTVIQAACAGARRGPYFEQDFRGGGVGARDAWARVLATRYGCDTTFLGRAPTPDMRPSEVTASYLSSRVGETACRAADMPEVIRAWSDSTGVLEEWAYSSRSTSTLLQFRPGGRCIVTLRGPNERELRVTGWAC